MLIFSALGYILLFGSNGVAYSAEVASATKAGLEC
jgi:hypothetical protein